MSASKSRCNRDQIDRLLHGDLPEATQTAVAEHIETCADCRMHMETLAGSDLWWSETRDAFEGLDPNKGLSSVNADLDEADDRHVASVPLDFLAPSDNPAMLGKLGEFEILEEIGCGGMGIVLKGYDYELNRFVAIKVLHPFCATSAAARRRFAREAQAAAAIVHQHVVAIHAVDANHHPPYLVMPFVPGESLQQRIARQGPLEVLDAVRIAQQVAEGLAAAHAQGLVHRDIKPGNILLERNVDRMLLTDFGLARAADDASLTRSGVIAGTPQYMSPEQARGDSVNHQTDLFSLGTVLYTMLAGHSPFRAETAMGVLRRVCDETPRSLREINPTVPEWLEALIAKLQAKRIEDRFSNASHVATLLQSCLAHLQQPTRFPLPNEVVALTRRRSSRSRGWAAIGLVVATVAALQVIARPARQQTYIAPDRTSPEITDRETVINDEWDDGARRESDLIRYRLNLLETEGAF